MTPTYIINMTDIISIPDAPFKGLTMTIKFADIAILSDVSRRLPDFKKPTTDILNLFDVSSILFIIILLPLIQLILVLLDK